jgi:hypothetical protein
VMPKITSTSAGVVAGLVMACLSHCGCRTFEDSRRIRATLGTQQPVPYARPRVDLPQDFFANRLGVGESTVPRPIGDNEGRALATRTAAQAPAVSP